MPYTTCTAAMKVCQYIYLANGRKGLYLNEEPGCDEGKTAVLPVEAVMVGIEYKVIQVEKPETYNKLHILY